jgi:cytochrome c-type biogenesis protein CcmE
VTAIILLAVAAIFMASAGNTAAYYKSVEEIATDTPAGERVKVGGAVVNGSRDKKSNPMTFTIRDEKDASQDGPVVKVVYMGSVPATFGDGVVAIVTGEVDEDGSITADEMITKCPSKYESATGAMPVGDLNEGQALQNVKLTGFVKPGSVAPPGGSERFILAENSDGTGKAVSVSYDGAIPEGMSDGSQLVITGELKTDAIFVAEEVALSK